MQILSLIVQILVFLNKNLPNSYNKESPDSVVDVINVFKENENFAIAYF